SPTPTTTHTHTHTHRHRHRHRHRHFSQTGRRERGQTMPLFPAHKSALHTRVCLCVCVCVCVCVSACVSDRIAKQADTHTFGVAHSQSREQISYRVSGTLASMAEMQCHHH